MHTSNHLGVAKHEGENWVCKPLLYWGHRQKVGDNCLHKPCRIRISTTGSGEMTTYQGTPSVEETVGCILVDKLGASGGGEVGFQVVKTPSKPPTPMVH